MSRRTPLLALTDIRDAIRRIERYVVGKDARSLAHDDMARDAVERCVEIISEASRRLPADLKATYPEIPWREIAAIGNVFRHDYDEIEPLLVWDVVRNHLPPLKRAVAAMRRRLKQRTRGG